MKINRKSELRQDFINRRRNLSRAEVEAASLRIAHKLTRLLPPEVLLTLMVYYPLGNEIDLVAWFKEYQKRGVKILLPRVEGGVLSAVRFTGEEQLRPSNFGVMEPVGAAYPLDEIDAVIVPGVAFDLAGYRIGYGKGYYDRFLPKLRPDTHTWGVGYHFQLLEAVGAEPHDWPLQKIITDSLEGEEGWIKH